MDTKKELACSICCMPYDSDKHCPRILPNCGHTFCTECLNQMQENNPARQIICPFDKKKYGPQRSDLSSFPKNFSLLQIIEDKINETTDLCEVHKKKLDYVDVTDKLIICEDCAKVRSSKHKVMPKQQLVTQINTTVTKIEQMIEIIEGHPNKVLKSVESVLEAKKFLK